MVKNSSQAKIEDREQEILIKSMNYDALIYHENIYDTLIKHENKNNYLVITLILHPPFMHAPLLFMRSEMA